jgi:DNA-directed RNA polymerase subunit RPC12/RpoP
MPEDLERMAKESGMFYCMDCKKTFMKKAKDSEVLPTELKCPHCGSTRIKPRAK